MSSATPPPATDQESWSWIGDDARLARVHGMNVPLVTIHPTDGHLVFWFMKRVTARRHLNTRMVTQLLTLGDVHLVLYEREHEPVRLVNMRTPNQSRPIDLQDLHEFFKLNAEPK